MNIFEDIYFEMSCSHSFKNQLRPVQSGTGDYAGSSRTSDRPCNSTGINQRYPLKTG